MLPAASGITNSGHPYLQGETHCFNRVLRATDGGKSLILKLNLSFLGPPQTSDYTYAVFLIVEMFRLLRRHNSPFLKAKGEIFPQRHSNLGISWHLLDRFREFDT
jgi:hypothetical protein